MFFKACRSTICMHASTVRDAMLRSFSSKIAFFLLFFLCTIGRAHQSTKNTTLVRHHRFELIDEERQVKN